MPAQELAFRRTKAIIWQATGYDEYGQPVVSPDPDELIVRWDDVQREAVDPRGNTVVVDATIIVDRDIPIGSDVWKGSLLDLPGTGVPSSDVMIVITREFVDDLKARETYRELGLMRKRDTLSVSS